MNTQRTAAVLLSCFLFSSSAWAGNADCTVVDDEFRALMNRDFLESPAKYLTTLTRQFSLSSFESRQKGLFFTVDSQYADSGIAIVRSGSGRVAKLRYQWVPGYEIVHVQEMWIYPDVATGEGAMRFDRRTESGRPIEIWTDCGLDIDSGPEVVCDSSADIMHRSGRRSLYLEAANGSEVHFPVESLCFGRPPLSRPTKPIPIPTFPPRPRLHSDSSADQRPAIDCLLAYDEIESFMNREFLIYPERYTTVENGRMSLKRWKTLGRGFLTGKGTDPNGAPAVGRTSNGNYTRFRYAFSPLSTDTDFGLTISDVIVSSNPIHGKSSRKDCKLAAPTSKAAVWAVDLDDCETVPEDDSRADLRLKATPDGAVLESINSARMKFPTESLCEKPQEPAFRISR